MAEPRYFYDMIAATAARLPNKESFRRRVGPNKYQGRTFSEIKTKVDQLVAGLVSAGINVGDRVTFLCDSSQNWFIVDCGIVTAGGVSTPRGTDVTDEDIRYIVSHSESRFAIVQKEKDRKRLESLRSDFPSLERIFVMEADDGSVASGKDTLQELLDNGKAAIDKDPEIVQKRLKETDPDAMATLIYTSGTTGAPKGVMLTQTGWIAGVLAGVERMRFRESDRAISLLPPWHAFERGAEYAVAYLGSDFLVTDTTNLRDDLVDFKPTLFPSVPRIWEMVYNGIMAKIQKGSSTSRGVFFFFLRIGEAWAKHRAILLGYDFQIKKPNPIWSFLRRGWSLDVLIFLSPFKLLSNVIFKRIRAAMGGQLRASISGGSALPAVVDRFLVAIGIPVLEGYGMTETCAVISVRSFSRPTSGTVGTPLASYEIKLKDDQGNLVTEPGERGTLWVKSNQILMGYYKRPELNEVVFDSDGFFDTGDLMRLTWRGELAFTGRAKDTIALGGGENVEPVPIEDKLIESEYIDQVMVVGDDQKTLGALIVPNFDRVKAQVTGTPEDPNAWNAHKEVRALFRGEITRLINKDNGFKSFEVIPGSCFYVCGREFDKDTEMTRTLKMKRPAIKDSYEKEIAGLYR